MVEVFTTSRAIRSFYSTFLDATVLLPQTMSIQELEQKSILLENCSLIDEEMRLLLMQEATKFSKFELLHIDSEFFVFLKNSDYLFRFFEELSYEKVAIESLKMADTYAQYDEHLDILQTLLQHYTALLEKHNFFDAITKVKHYSLNHEFIRSLKSVHIHLEGFLSRFERDLLTQIASLIPLHVSFISSAYNQKTVSLFAQKGMSFKANHHYRINLSTSTILEEEPWLDDMSHVEVYGFTSRLSQVAYVHNTIARFVEEGIRPEEIVVVLPDERFAEVLRGLDSLNNLNFAMGISLAHSHLYQHLSAIEKAIRYDTIVDRTRLARYDLDAKLLFTCKEYWGKKIPIEELMALLMHAGMLFPKEMEHPVFKEAFFAFEHFLQKAPALRFEQMLKLFLNRLLALSIDDVRGGKVTVLGLLETRGVAYKGVIVIDFSDDNVPKRSQKDLFLSSQIRAHAGLPTQKDRENLQRYYYHQLFSKAQKVAIGYSKEERVAPSRFLEELGLPSTQMADEKPLYTLLFEPHNPKKAYECDFIDAPYYLSSHPLSATKLKTLLTCKRQFYFRYCVKLQEALMPSEQIDELSIGRIVHHVLEHALCNETLVNPAVLYTHIEKALKAHNSNEVWGYFSDVWLEQLKPFIGNEVNRFHEGYRILSKEKKYTLSYKGFSLEGHIDRIDQLGESLFVIDYKSGKVPQTSHRSLEGTTDFQLVFYALMAQSFGKIGGVYYYDLKKGILIEESFLEEKKVLLDAHLEGFRAPINGYEKCETLATCRYCPYIRLCGKEDVL